MIARIHARPALRGLQDRRGHAAEWHHRPRAGALLTVAWVPALSGCLMMGGMGPVSTVGEPVQGQSGQVYTPLESAEATNGDLTIAISFPTPGEGASVSIDARLRAERDDLDLTNASVWLRIHTPHGSVDRLVMQQLDSAPPGTYRAQYDFPVAGRYVVTVEGRAASGPGARMISASREVNVGTGAHGSGHDWLMPAAVVGGLGMLALMALMIGSGH